MATPDFTKEELELLSPEEREGLLDKADEIDDENDLTVGDSDSDGADDADAAAALAAAAAADTSGIGADPLKPAIVIEGEVVVDPLKKAAEELAAGADVLPKTTAPSFPKFEAPADAKEKLAGIEAQLDAIEAKFDDGDLDAKERRAQSKQLEQERRQLERLIDRAELSRDVSIETWTESTVPQFFVKHTQYAPGTPLYANLDFEVRQIQQASENPFDPSILERAHKAIQDKARAALGLPPEDPAKPSPKPAPVVRRDLPPSLAGIPAADITDTIDNSEFAHLDRLAEKPGNDASLKYEQELAKLTDDQRDRYLAAG